MIATAVFLSAIAAGKPLEMHSLGSIDQDQRYTVSVARPAPMPKEAFMRFELLRPFATDPLCKKAIESRRIIDKLTGELYTAVYTNKNICDGGNAFGVIFRGSIPRSSMIRFLINDSDFRKVKP